jgi:hypothetical protein
MLIKFWVNKGLTEEESKNKIKTQRKLNKEFWISKGLSNEEAIIKVSEFQKSNKNK